MHLRLALLGLVLRGSGFVPVGVLFGSVTGGELSGSVTDLAHSESLSYCFRLGFMGLILSLSLRSCILVVSGFEFHPIRSPI